MHTRVSRQKAVALVAGLGGAWAVTAVCFAVDGVPTTVPALLLLVPIGVAGVLGGVMVAVIVAIVAATLYALAFLHPVGAVRIGLTEDMLVLCTFLAVGIGVAMLSDRRKKSSTVLDEERAQLLRGVSHDLRNPLTTIRAVSSDLLDDAAYDPAQRSELLHLVVDESERLDRIVGNLLRVSRPHAEVFAPHQAEHDLSELVDACCQRFNRRRGAFAAVEHDIEPALPLVYVDPVQFDQVLTNLLENARRVAPSGTVVSVTGRRSGSDHVLVSVNDAGPGFTKVELAHAFDPFHSSSASTGLGLTVSKAIVDAHGGAIAVRNLDHGGGCVEFTIPVVTGRSISLRRNIAEIDQRG